MGVIKDKFHEKSEKLSLEVKDMLKEHGDKVIGEVKLAQIYQGMRGMTGLVTETSLLDAQDGIRFRGYSIPELREKLPKADGGTEPLPEGIFYLMLVGELPTAEDVQHVTNVWQRRSHVPSHVFHTIDALPLTAHPMTQFVVGIMALQTESQFAKKYATGMNKKDYWEAVFDDSMDLIARLPRIAAYVYRRKYKSGQHIQPNGLLDWAGNLAHMMGYEDESFRELMRLYKTIHCDHEGGNVSAHATHLVGSALSDPFLSYSAGLLALAGLLHGLAAQEVLRWILKMRAQNGDNFTDQDVKDYLWRTLKSGQVVPGYGHGGLRKPDPRFEALMDFAATRTDILKNPVFRLVKKNSEIAPSVLTEHGKVRNFVPSRSHVLLYFTI